MRPIILECVEVGLFMTALLPEHPLFYASWLTPIFGALLQWFLMRRKRQWLWWVLPVGAVTGLIVCEVWYQVLNGGWETLLPMIIYGWCLILLAGAVIGWVLYQETQAKN